ncbi:hypothetical protein PROFUN_03314 [Planoprotostelium fungivorum]|uniref:Uncharacterized protein n=1 Tax=Planoprotostelium fungivorum TaxID=1890364 RepID=A0A2P6NWR6_9EUKA|nr:hypothetical protein PROFUN_03314 [Planoprotostelium fungivorum]
MSKTSTGLIAPNRNANSQSTRTEDLLIDELKALKKMSISCDLLDQLTKISKKEDIEELSNMLEDLREQIQFIFKTFITGSTRNCQCDSFYTEVSQKVPPPAMYPPMMSNHYSGLPPTSFHPYSTQSLPSQNPSSRPTSSYPDTPSPTSEDYDTQEELPHNVFDGKQEVST